MSELQKYIKTIKSVYKIPAQVGTGLALDIGSNVGAFPVVNSGRFGRIVCFEPSQSNFKMLNENVSNANISNCVTVNMACSNTKEKKVKLYDHVSGNIGAKSLYLEHHETGMWDKDIYEEVNVISWNDILVKYVKDDIINYLKMDCEGAEYELLYGTCLTNIECIGIEIHNLLGSEKITELQNHLEKTHKLINLTSPTVWKCSNFQGVYLRKDLL